MNTANELRESRTTKGVVELRQRDGSTVVAQATFEAPEGAALPDVIHYNRRLYHQIAQGAKLIFIESIVFDLGTAMKPASEATT